MIWQHSSFICAFSLFSFTNFSIASRVSQPVDDDLAALELHLRIFAVLLHQLLDRQPLLPLVRRLARGHLARTLLGRSRALALRTAVGDAQLLPEPRELRRDLRRDPSLEVLGK